MSRKLISLLVCTALLLAAGPAYSQPASAPKPNGVKQNGVKKTEVALVPPVQPSTQPTAIQTPIEKLHRPILRLPEMVEKDELAFVTIEVGDPVHQQKKEHRIEWIEVFVNGEKAFHADLTPLVAEARLTVPFRFEQNSTLKVEAHCNQHGTWGAEVQARVSSPVPAA